MDIKIDKKLIKKKAKEKIKEGKPKQEVYDELVYEFRYRNDIAKIVREIPTNKRWAKFGYLNTIYLVFFSILMTFLFILQPNGGMLIIGGIIYIVAAKKFSQYYWNIILGIIVELTFIGLLIIEGSNLNIPLTVLLFVVPLILILAGIYLPKLIAPPFTEVKESFVTTDGQQKLRLVHKFVE